MLDTTNQSKFAESSARLSHQKARNNAYWGIKKQGELVYKKLKYLTDTELMIVRHSIKKTENTIKDPNLSINGISPKQWYNLLADECNYRIYREESLIHSILEALEMSMQDMKQMIISESQRSTKIVIGSAATVIGGLLSTVVAILLVLV